MKVHIYTHFIVVYNFVPKLSAVYLACLFIFATIATTYYLLAIHPPIACHTAFVGTPEIKEKLKFTMYLIVLHAHSTYMYYYYDWLI